MGCNDALQVLSRAPRLCEKFDQPVTAHDQHTATCVCNRAAGRFAGSPRVDEQPHGVFCDAQSSESGDMSALDVRAVALGLNEHPGAAISDLPVKPAVARVSQVALDAEVVVFNRRQDQLFEYERVDLAEIAESTGEAVLLRCNR